MSTSVRHSFHLPQSLDDLPWQRAERVFDSLDDSPAKERPSQSTINGFTKACAKKYSDELNFLLIRIQHLFHKYLPKASQFKNSIKFLKHRLVTHRISPRELPEAKFLLSESIPSQLTPAEKTPDMRDALTEATQKVLFLQRLVAHLPMSIFHQESRSLHHRAEVLFSQCQELVEIRTTVAEVRQIQSCIAKMQDLDNRRNILFEEIKTLRGERSEYHKLLRLQNAFDQIRLDFIHLSRQVDTVHNEYPTLFTLDLEALGDAIRKNYIHMMRLLSTSAPSPLESVARHLRETLSRISFQDLLNPESNTHLYIHSCAHHYHTFNHLPDLPEEYGIAHTLDATVKSYKHLERALLANNYLHLQYCEDIELLAKLEEEDLAPLRQLFETQALPFIRGRTPQMQRRLLRQFKNIFSRCPSLCSPLVAGELEKIASKLPPAQEVNHEKHETELRASICTENKLYGLQFIAKHIQENTLNEISMQELYRFRDVYGPNYAAFQGIISNKLQKLSHAPARSVQEKDLVTFIAYIQEMIKYCPQLDAKHRLSEQITNALRYHNRTRAMLGATHVHFKIKEEHCNPCVQEKIASDQWEQLTLSEVNHLHWRQDEQTLLEDRLQLILDTYTRDDLLIWKEDHFDPFIERCNQLARHYERKLSDLDFVQSFVQEVSYRITPPSLWDWIIVFFGDLLRMLRH